MNDPPAPGVVQEKYIPKNVWKKGQSGNPLGSAKTPPEVRAYLKEKSIVAARALVAVIENPLSEPKNVISAAKTVLEFSCSKPQPEQSSAAGDVLEKLAGLLTKRVEDDADDDGDVVDVLGGVVVESEG